MARLRVILGAMEFGRFRLVQPQACYNLIDLFLSKGHTEIDTALSYTDGESERILGQHTAITDPKVSIATKCNPWWPQGLKRESVLEQVSTSLASLQTSCVDILYLHAPDHNTPIEETLGACQQLYKEGKLKELGLSNFSSWLVADVYHICKRNEWVLPTVYQGMYNPITRMVESELFPALRYFGLRFYAYNPLAGGLLTGRYSTDQQADGRFWTVGGAWSQKYRDRYWRESTFKGVELVRQALDETYGTGQVSLVSATFRWLNHHSQMKPECGDGIIIGAGKWEHLESNLDACTEGPLEEAVINAFEESWEADRINCANYFR